MQARSAPPIFKVREHLDCCGVATSVCEDPLDAHLGGDYLVVEVPGRSGPCWIAAPASERAIAAVRAGRTSPWSVLHHSATGTVEVFRSMLDGTVRESTVLCANLPAGDTVLAAA